MPSNTALPSISGLLQVGKILTASPGTWTGTPTITFGYQWQTCPALGGTCSNIANAIKSTLEPILAWVGLRMRVIVTATNAAGSTTAESPVTGLISGLL